MPRSTASPATQLCRGEAWIVKKNLGWRQVISKGMVSVYISSNTIVSPVGALPYNPDMHQINDAVVMDGKLMLSNLPFAEGQHVRIVVEEADEPLTTMVSIHEIRRLLAGGVERFDDALEPIIPQESWEMLK